MMSLMWYLITNDDNQNTPSDCVFLLLLKKMQFFLQKFEVKTESGDCEVYKKPNVKRFTSQDMGKHPRSNHDDHLTV